MDASKPEIYQIHFEGMGTGGPECGIYKAKSKLKSKPDGSVAVCRFWNGHATFIKADGKVRPITEEEITNIKNEIHK